MWKTQNKEIYGMKPYKIYSDDIDPVALDQFFDAMKEDFVVQGAMMPDAHVGYSLPIGGVVATNDVVVPAWVGFDIGCGMCANKLNIKASMLDEVKDIIFNKIYDLVPVGRNAHPNDFLFNTLTTPSFQEDVKDVCVRVLESYEDAKAKIGTLGSGNHFIEIGADENNDVWIVVHSGSRHFGHSIASHYMKLASGTNKAKEGHFGFDVNSENGKAYIHDMNVALEYALYNRKIMLYLVIDAIKAYLGQDDVSFVDEDALINRNHNHAEERNGIWIHRKGATHAEKDMMGVIPGNMRDGSYIVCGKGNPDSLYSSSHGAGRILGRRKAKEQLDVNIFELMMSGIVAKVGKNTLDESPMVYKNINKVMENQEDLVDVIAHVKPIINIKG
jgi:tRNA-splicing ligase RtcB